MTILEGKVAPENWTALEQAYQAASEFQEPGLERSFLIQNSREPEMWRILTLWTSREALEKMRTTAETPRGILIFRQAGSEPQLSIFDVRYQIQAG